MEFIGEILFKNTLQNISIKSKQQPSVLEFAIDVKAAVLKNVLLVVSYSKAIKCKYQGYI